MRSQWIRYGEGFCIIYSITSSNSFETLDKEINPLLTRLDIANVNELSSLGPSLPLALFGNKVDLANQRQVTEEQGKEMAQKLGATFFEGSAKQCINVNETFFSIVRAIRLDRKGEKQIFQAPQNGNGNDNGNAHSNGARDNRGTSGRRTMERLCYLF
jgi:GTPase KRas protein